MTTERIAGRGAGVVDLGRYQERIDAALADLTADRIVARIWAHDHTVWKPDPAEIANRLGWLRSPERMRDALPAIAALTDAVRTDGYTHALLLGMGGSSLAPEVLRATLGVREGYLDLAVLDSTDPGAVLSHARRLDPATTLFIVSTKSGGTVETFSLFKYFYNTVADRVGADRAGAHFMAITDPGSGLAEVAARYRFRTTFLNDPTIGGRYSALSYFGLAPAALTGADIPTLLDRATAMARRCAPGTGADDNPGAWLGVIIGELAAAGRDKLTLIASSSIAALGTWVEQLIAESTGKEGRGVLPVDGEPLAPPDAYAGDRAFVHIRLDQDTSHDAKVARLGAAGHPLVTLSLGDRYDLGGAFFQWELATAIAGHRLGINPFDQPNVESAKALARQMVEAYQKEGRLPAPAPALQADGIAVVGAAEGRTPGEALRRFLGRAAPGDGGAGRSYVALQAYLQPTPQTTDALQRLRRRIQATHRLATTLGYGPRFLHSTGQLHKGDAGRGLFVQITADDTEEAPIPDQAGSPRSSITFGVLKMAQALGDRQALLEAGRQVIRFHFRADVQGGLAHLADAL